MVTITVLCCDPEKIRDKLCCKGSRVIKSIEIKDPKKKPKEHEKTTDKVVIAGEQPNKPVENTKEALTRGPPSIPPKKPAELVPVHDFLPLYPVRTCCGQCYEGYGEGPCYQGYGVPVRTCCGQCYEGYGGGPCYQGYGVPPPPCYDGYGYGGYGRDCHTSRCDYYFTGEKPSSCSIM